MAVTTSAVRGQNSEVLISARLPAAMAPTSGDSVSSTGTFHGPMMPITPRGW